MYDIIIVGGGPAGLTAAIYTKRAGFSTLLLEAGVLGGQAATTPEIENWPGSARLTGADFSGALYQQSAALGAEIKFEGATGLEDQGAFKVVTTSAGARYEARAVILANGVRRRKLGVPGELELAGRGVSYCATCDGNFFKGRDVAVVGGGNTALEDALFLSSLCPCVWLVYRGSGFRGERHLADSVGDVKNIHILTDTHVLAVEGNVKTTGLRVAGPKGERTLPVSGIFVAIGLEPDNWAFSPPLSLDTSGYILAGEDCATNLPGIFAAGDTRSKGLRQLVTAASDGAAAADGAGKYLREHAVP